MGREKKKERKVAGGSKRAETILPNKKMYEKKVHEKDEKEKRKFMKKLVNPCNIWYHSIS